MKTCTKCGSSSNEFPPKGYRCRMCVREYHTEYWHKNKTSLRAKRDQWAKNNPERMQESRKKWVSNNAQKHAESRAKYVLNNPEKRFETQRRYREQNKEKIARYSVTYYQKTRDKQRERGIEYRKKNKEKIRSRVLAWSRTNAARVSYLARKHQLARKSATPSWANQFFIEEAYDLAKRRSEITGIKWHVDHIVPIQSKIVCGLHCEFNLQVITASENKKKSNRYWENMP